jgi:spoIIIJ-associated protein
MTSIEKTGRTVDEAITAALEELGVTRDQVEVEVLEQEGRALFGILGHTQARVRVTLKATPGVVAAALAQEILDAMPANAKAELTREDDEQALINLSGEDLGMLIGKHGNTLAALQHLVGLITARKTGVHKRIVLDAEGYRERREEALRGMAKRAARRAIESGREVSLDPLPANERRIVHIALAEDKRVTTTSVGEDPFRRLIIAPKGAAAGQRRRGAREGREGTPPSSRRRGAEARPQEERFYTEQDEIPEEAAELEEPEEGEGLPGEEAGEPHEEERSTPDQ